MPSLSQLFSTKDGRFYDLFEEAGHNMVAAAELIERMLGGGPDRNALAKEVRTKETSGDRITHDLIHRLNQTFVTPIDREDIFALASSIDDVVDLIEEVAEFVNIYEITEVSEYAQQFAHTLSQACTALAAAIPNLRSLSDISKYTLEVNRLENVGDKLIRRALGELFKTEKDPLLVIKWKDIFERLEDAIDATERVANILEGIVIKNT